MIVTKDFIHQGIKEHDNNIFFILTSLSLLVICIASTGNKWQWMLYALIAGYSVFFTGLEHLSPALKTLSVSAILWLSILEHLFFKNSNWFKDMTAISKQISARNYYFPEHENMIHYKLLHQFDTSSQNFYDLEKHPFMIFAIHYSKLDTKFSPWVDVGE